MMKRKLSTIILVLAYTLMFISCSTSSDPEPEVVASGFYSFQNTNYNGNCTSVNKGSNINVKIAGSPGSFIIYNMPKASSGTFAFTDGYDNINSNDKLYAFLAISPDLGTVNGGTLTKTGANTFTFSCGVYSILAPSSVYIVIGGGKY